MTIEPCNSTTDARRKESEAIIKEQPLFNKAQNSTWIRPRSINAAMTKHNLEQKRRAEKRAKQVAKMKNGGKTFAEIAAHFNFSSQRAQQLYAVATALKNVE